MNQNLGSQRTQRLDALQLSESNNLIDSNRISKQDVVSDDTHDENLWLGDYKIVTHTRMARMLSPLRWGYNYPELVEVVLIVNPLLPTVSNYIIYKSNKW